MFPLGIIPALIGAVLFYGYLQDKDEINRYLFLFLSITLFTTAFFCDSIETAAYVYGPDPALASLGYAFGFVLFAFFLILMIRLGIGNVVEWVKHFGE